MKGAGMQNAECREEVTTTRHRMRERERDNRNKRHNRCGSVGTWCALRQTSKRREKGEKGEKGREKLPGIAEDQLKTRVLLASLGEIPTRVCSAHS
jgi:hypothetical protein